MSSKAKSCRNLSYPDATIGRQHVCEGSELLIVVFDDKWTWVMILKTLQRSFKELCQFCEAEWPYGTTSTGITEWLRSCTCDRKATDLNPRNAVEWPKHKDLEGICILPHFVTSDKITKFKPQNWFQISDAGYIHIWCCTRNPIHCFPNQIIGLHKQWFTANWSLRTWSAASWWNWRAHLSAIIRVNKQFCRSGNNKIGADFFFF